MRAAFGLFEGSTVDMNRSREIDQALTNVAASCCILAHFTLEQAGGTLAAPLPCSQSSPAHLTMHTSTGPTFPRRPPRGPRPPSAAQRAWICTIDFGSFAGRLTFSKAKNVTPNAKDGNPHTKVTPDERRNKSKHAADAAGASSVSDAGVTCFCLWIRCQNTNRHHAENCW